MSKFVNEAAKILSSDSVGALVLNEDDIGLSDTIDHLRQLGFETIVIANLAETALSLDDVPSLQFPAAPRHEILTKLIQEIKGSWLHICFNAEFLAFPFSETRTIKDFTGFLQDERRKAAHVTVVDHYAVDLGASEYGFSKQDAQFDRSGYYARHSETPEDPKEPIVDIFGGLRWRYEEEFPEDRRTCNRAALFRCREDLVLGPDFKFTDQHMNTLQCPWHHSATAALRSFRAAKYLMINPGSRTRINDLTWPQSTQCDWSSQQLMELGFIEPGQWF